ncbi:MAG: hypothetical protein M3142_14005 [Bacteroidota bacterium]|nr:hypothetical protein [Bacteroidota bacterium]
MKDIDSQKVSFRFFDFECSPDELIKEPGLDPTRTGFKSQEYNIGPENKGVKKAWLWNFWKHQITTEKKDIWIGDQIGCYFDQINKPRVKKLIILADFEAEIGVNIYVLGNEQVENKDMKE